MPTAPLPHPRLSRHSPSSVSRDWHSSTVLIYLTLTVRTGILSILQMGRLRCQQSNHLPGGVLSPPRSWLCPCACLALCFPTGASQTVPQGHLGLQSPGVLPLALSEAMICVCVCFSREMTRNEMQPQLRCGVSGSGSRSGLPTGRTVMETRLSECPASYLPGEFVETYQL